MNQTEMYPTRERGALDLKGGCAAFLNFVIFSRRPCSSLAGTTYFKSMHVTEILGPNFIYKACFSHVFC